MGQNVELTGRHVCLEPLDLKHVEGLVAAAAPDPSLYRWSPVPQGHAEARKYVEAALAWQSAGTALPFATVRLAEWRCHRINSLLEHRALGLAAGP